MLLATVTSSSFAEVSGTLEKDGEDLFFITEERIAYIKSPECQKFVSDNSTTYKVKFLGVDQDIKKTKLIGLTEIEFESGSRILSKKFILLLAIPLQRQHLHHQLW